MCPVVIANEVSGLKRRGGRIEHSQRREANAVVSGPSFGAGAERGDQLDPGGRDCGDICSAVMTRPEPCSTPQTRPSGAKEEKEAKKKECGGLMETDRAAEKPQTVFPQPCAKPFGFRTVPIGPAINRQPKPDRSLATKPGHFNLLLTGFVIIPSRCPTPLLRCHSLARPRRQFGGVDRRFAMGWQERTVTRFRGSIARSRRTRYRQNCPTGDDAERRG